MNLGEQFRSNVKTAAPNAPIRDVVQTMKEDNIGAVVIVKGKKPEVAGIVTDRDVALALALGKATPESPVKDVMTKKVVTIWEDQGVFNATQYFLGHQIRRLPIINRDNELVGIVTFDDILGLLAGELFNISKAVLPALGEDDRLWHREPLITAAS